MIRSIIVIKLLCLILVAGSQVVVADRHGDFNGTLFFTDDERQADERRALARGDVETDQHTRDHEHKQAEHSVLRTEEGHRGFLDLLGDGLHVGIAGVLLADPARRDERVGQRDDPGDGSEEK